MRLGQLITGQGDNLDSVLRIAPLAADALAMAGRQGGQEVVEGRVAGVMPVVLLILPQQQTRLPQPFPIGLSRKGDVDRRGAALFARRAAILPRPAV